MNWTRPAWLFAAVIAALAAGGCYGLWGDPVEVGSPVALNGTKVLVLPFGAADPGAGTELTDLVSMELATLNRGAYVLSGNYLPGEVGLADIDNIPWQTLRDELGVDFAVAGRITELSLKDPKAINLYRGRMKIDLSMHDARYGGGILWRGTLAVAYPEGEVQSWGVASSDTTEEEFRNEYLEYAAAKIAEHVAAMRVRRTAQGGG